MNENNGHVVLILTPDERDEVAAALAHRRARRAELDIADDGPYLASLASLYATVVCADVDPNPLLVATRNALVVAPQEV